MSKATRRRRKRRQQRAAQRHGVSAKPRHVGRSGRTGGMHAKKSPSKRSAARTWSPPRSIVDSARCEKCGAMPGEAHEHGRVARRS